MAALIELCLSDIYLHVPHGSNNRLNGNQDNVRNDARLFDSQVGLYSDLYCISLSILSYFKLVVCYISGSTFCTYPTAVRTAPQYSILNTHS